MRGDGGGTAGRKESRENARQGGGTEAGNDGGRVGGRKLSNEISAGRTVAPRRVQPIHGMMSAWRYPVNILDIDN